MTNRRLLSGVCSFAMLLLLGACGSDSSSTSDDAGSTQVPIPDTNGSAGDGGTHPGDAEPWANVYPVNPVEDNKQTSEVLLKHITSADGTLTGTFAEVYNCLNEDGGETFDFSLGGITLAGKVCNRKQTAIPGEDGTYLHITPPQSDGDGNDPFAEVMMYHHVTTIHDHYQQTLGVQELDSLRLRALVNVQVYLDMMGGWWGMMNAAFVPASSGSLLKQYFGVDLNEGKDMLMFFQDTLNPSPIDPAYDATVIYHEYTHAALGAERFWGTPKDKYGLNPTPLAMNEGLADYLPSSFVDNHKMGTYALGSLGAARDLTRVFTCPEHIVGEQHQDGEVAANVLWAMREIVGKEVADQAVWNSIAAFGMETTFDEVAQTLLAEINTLAPDKQAQVQTLFEERGFLGCVRLMPHQDFDKSGSMNPSDLPPMYPGADATFPDGTPAYMQYSLQLLPTTQELTIEYAPVEGEAGLMGMGGSTKGDVWVALHKGSDPITYDYSSGKAISSALVVLKGEDAGNSYKLVLSGNCISGGGDLVFQFVNKGFSTGQINKVQVTQSETSSMPEPNFELCN